MNPFIVEVTQGGYQEEKIKLEGLLETTPSSPNNVAQQYELETKKQWGKGLKNDSQLNFWFKLRNHYFDYVYYWLINLALLIY